MIFFVQDIAAELRGQYTITYRSLTPGPDSEKAIRVRATSPDVQVRYRRDKTPTPPPAKSTGKK